MDFLIHVIFVTKHRLLNDSSMVFVLCRHSFDRKLAWNDISNYLCSMWNSKVWNKTEAKKADRDSLSERERERRRVCVCEKEREGKKIRINVVSQKCGSQIKIGCEKRINGVNLSQPWNGIKPIENRKTHCQTTRKQFHNNHQQNGKYQQRQQTKR